MGCSLARAEFDQVRSGAEVYALFAAKCETPAWCTCKQSLQQSGPILIPGFGSGGGFSNPNNCVGSDGAGGKHRSGWCLSGEEGVCCQGLRCVQEKEEVVRKSSLVLWGIEMLTGVGSCVSG